MSTRTYVSSLPVDITVSTDGTVSVVVDVTEIAEAIYRNENDEQYPENQHRADIRRAVAAKLAGRITVTAMGGE